MTYNLGYIKSFRHKSSQMLNKSFYQRLKTLFSYVYLFTYKFSFIQRHRLWILDLFDKLESQFFYTRFLHAISRRCDFLFVSLDYIWRLCSRFLGAFFFALCPARLFWFGILASVRPAARVSFRPQFYLVKGDPFSIPRQSIE